MKDIRFSEQFLYTQQSLSAFQSCPMKFRKRYMEGLRWENRPSEEAERALDQGRRFHLLARRYFLGVDEGLQEDCRDFEVLKQWTDVLKSQFTLSPDVEYLPEYTLRMRMGRMRLEANFDLVVVKRDRLEIWDWKTHTPAATRNIKTLQLRLEKSLQTMVYLFVLREQAAIPAGRPFLPEAISMKYWQPEVPHIVAGIDYEGRMHEDFGAKLEQLIREIEEYDYTRFDKSFYRKYCKYCEFNWYCNRERTEWGITEGEAY